MVWTLIPNTRQPPWNQALLRNQLTHVKAEIFFHLRQLKSVSEEKILKCVWSAHISQAMPVLQLSAWSDNVGHFSSYKPRNVTSMLLVYKPFPITPWSILHALISHRHFCSPRRSLHLTLRSAGARITWRWIMDCVNLVQFAAWTVMKCQLLIIDVESNALAGWVLSGRLLCGGSPVGHVRIHSR